MYERILVPLDGSPLSESILPYAGSLAKALNFELVLLHVIVRAAEEFADPNKTPLAPQVGVDAEAKRDMTIYIKDICTKLEKEGMRVTYLVREGPVTEKILEDAKITKADLIAMSTHGRSGVQRLLMGSNTEWMIKNSPVPVMVIHPKTAEKSQG
jgi:nucleotide-binding universal stress UspA family protein